MDKFDVKFCKKSLIDVVKSAIFDFYDTVHQLKFK